MNEHRTSLFPRSLATAALTLVVATAGVPALAATQNDATETMTVSDSWTNTNMAQLAASSGRLLLERIETAKNMIDSGHVQAARDELSAAEDTAGAIETMMPFIVVVDQIRDAKNKLLAEDTDQFQDDLIPIYARLDEMSIYAPQVAKNAKGQLRHAERQAASGNTEEAGKAMDSVSDYLTDSTVYMPVDYVNSQVAVARIALSGDAPDAAVAKRAIQNAEQSLVTVVTTYKGDQTS